jgi:hypothetical protein
VARTDAGRILTEQHRRAQLQVRAQALRDYLRLWPIWEGDEESFFAMVAATLVLIRVYHGLSASLAASYFESFRVAEGAKGEAIPRVAGPINEDKVTAGLVVTGRDALRDALAAGRAAEEAREVALTQTSGSVSRQVLTGGRETILRSVAEDKEALGWTRVTDDDPCPFCALLAGRGPVYEEDTVDFEAHDSCACGAEAVYWKDAEWPGRAREFHDLYNEAILEAREADELDRGTKNDLLNAFRRRYERERLSRAA